MKIKKSNRNIFLVALSCIIAVIMALSVVYMLESSYVEVKTDTGTYSTYINYFDKAGATYEDSILFENLFEETIWDLTRLCVIRSQLETNGKYDANKKIDIAKYANRSNVVDLKESLSLYKLDDLVKWGNYGYDFRIVYGTDAQLDAYFLSLKGNENTISVQESDTIHVSALDMHNNESDGSLKEFIENSVYPLPEEYYSIEANQDLKPMYILVDRYKSAEGKNLIEYAQNPLEYEALIRYLCISADNLFYNFKEYNKLLPNYAKGKTNVIYCYQLNNEFGNDVRFDNLNQNVTGMTNDEITKIFTGFKKYICFNPDKMQMVSNIEGIDAEDLQNYIRSYEYAFGDGSRIWLSINDEYLAQDIFRVTKNEYVNDFMFVPSMGILIVSTFLQLILMILMTLQAGKVTVVYEDGETDTIVKPAKWDNISIEIYVILVGFIAFFVLGILAMTDKVIFGSTLLPRYSSITYVVFAANAAFAAITLVPLYLMLVRKIKCNLIWNGSITKKIVDKTKSMVVEAYDNGNLIARTWLPFLLFLAFNLVLVLMGIVGTFIAFILDMILGVWLYKEAKVREDIVEGITVISDGDFSHKIETQGMHGDNLALANAVNSIGDGIRVAVEKSMKDEKMKADLITNVSHDIKTPLTSIINFVDLLKRENIEDEKIKGYIDVLEQKSQKLKALTNDLVEASKISSGNITLNFEKLNMPMLINQSIGEFMEKFEEKQLTPVLRLPDTPIYVMADSRGIYRVVDNLYNNIYKYALPGTRIYVDMESSDGKMTVAFKNISAEPLNIDVSELTERFVRGDSSRKTEGSGLGLSIAKSLTEAQKGTFEISLDGDLFKVIIGFNLA